MKGKLLTGQFKRSPSSKNISFAGTMSFITNQTFRLRDIHLLKNLLQYHVDTDSDFWLEAYRTFSKELEDSKAKRKRKQFSEVAPHNFIAAVVNKQKRNGWLDGKRVSVLQTSVSSIDLTAPRGSRDTSHGLLCKECSKCKGSVRSLVNVLNRTSLLKSPEWKGSKASFFRSSSLDKDKMLEEVCCLTSGTCHHSNSSSLCCKVNKCQHSDLHTRYMDESLPAPPPRGRSSAETVQALKMRIETATPEIKSKRGGRRNEVCAPRQQTTPHENNVSRGMTSSLDQENFDKSPNTSVRSEGSGNSSHCNSEEKPSSANSNGVLHRTLNSKDSVRTPIGRNSGKQYISTENMPTTSDNDLGYLKEELVVRLMKEKEELLELRRRKESQREKLLQFRRDQENDCCKELDVTPTPVPYTPDRHIVLETPQKFEDSSPESFVTPRPCLLENLKSDAALSFQDSLQRRSSDLPVTSGMICCDLKAGLNHREGEYISTPTKCSVDLAATPTQHTVYLTTTPTSGPVRAKFYDRVPESEPGTPTQANSLPYVALASYQLENRLGFQRCVSTPYKQTQNHVYANEVELIATTPAASDLMPIFATDTPNEKQNYKQPLSRTQSTPIEVYSLDQHISPEVKSPFNERAVDCPTLPKASLSNSNGYHGNLVKLSPQGFDVVRAVVKGDEERDGQVVNPALLQPFRRRSRKSKEKERCNTQ